MAQIEPAQGVLRGVVEDCRHIDRQSAEQASQVIGAVFEINSLGVERGSATAGVAATAPTNAACAAWIGVRGWLAPAPVVRARTSVRYVISLSHGYLLGLG